MNGGVVGDARADRVPGAAIDDVVVAQRQNAAIIVKADLDVVQLVARMGRAHQMLAPVLDPAHRPAEPAGEEGDQQVLGIDVAFAAKAAADIERDAAHARFRQAQKRGRLAPNPVHHLGRGPDRHRVGARIIGADDAAAFHRHGGIAMVIEAALQTGAVRAPVRPSTSPRPTEKFADQVGAGTDRARWRLSGRSAASGSTTAGNSSRSICTSSAASSAWARLSATMIAIASPTCRTLSCARSGCCGLRNLCSMTEVHLRGNDNLSLGHRRQQLQQIGAVEREHHAGCGNGAREVDRADAGVRHRARRRTACNMRGRTRSAMNCPWPISSRRSSRRKSERPT